MSSAARSCLILAMVHLCVALHYPRLENGICSLKGGHCLLASNASICNLLNAECDEGYICCEAPVPMPRPIAKQAAATCSSQTQDVDGESGSISVWSENNYENNLDCQWRITVEAGKVILIEWVNIDIEDQSTCDWDYVEIVGQKFCGSVTPDSFTSPNKQVLIKFHTDDLVQKKGFSLRYSFVSKPPTGCKDNDKSCEKWSQSGECKKNPDWMLINCKKSCGVCDDTACGVVNSQTRIVGGEETLVHQYPWQVALVSYYGYRPFCGGSIISSRWILTAAHCVAIMTTTDSMVVVGEHNWTTDDETTFTTRVKIEQLVIHPSYNDKTVDNDIALVKLRSELTFTQANRIAPICLPPLGTQDQFENVDAIVSGWGKLSVSDDQPDILNHITVPTMSNTQCQQKWGSKITDNMICTGLPESNKGPYTGDSGGPLVTEADGHMIQIGVVSWGSSNLTPGFPQIYARVTRFMTWILSYVNKDAK